MRTWSSCPTGDGTPIPGCPGAKGHLHVALNCATSLHCHHFFTSSFLLHPFFFSPCLQEFEVSPQSLPQKDVPLLLHAYERSHPLLLPWQAPSCPNMGGFSSKEELIP